MQNYSRNIESATPEFWKCYISNETDSSTTKCKERKRMENLKIKIDLRDMFLKEQTIVSRNVRLDHKNI